MILDLLPSREVTLSACVLMQDSDNVFEMTPALRITVFKQLFDLLDMDHVRDHLAEVKKITQLRRQVLQEDMTVQDQFSVLYTQIRSLVQASKQITIPQLQERIDVRLQQPFLLDSVQLEFTQVRMESSFLQGYSPQITTDLLQFIDVLLQSYLLQQGQAKQLVVQQDELHKILGKHEQEMREKKQRLQYIASQLGETDEQHLIQLQIQIQEIDTQLDLLRQKIPLEQAKQFGVTFTSILQAQQTMYQHIADARQLQQELATYGEQENLLVRQQEQTQKQLVLTEQQIDRLEKDHVQAQVYHCPKIQQDCPYVAFIRQTST